MSAFWQFKALFIKNLLTMKRNVFLSIAEIFFPIVLVLIGFLVRKAFKTEKHFFTEEGSMSEFITDKSNMGMNMDHIYKTYPMVALTLMQMNNTNAIKYLLMNKIMSRDFGSSELNETLNSLLNINLSYNHELIVQNLMSQATDEQKALFSDQTKMVQIIKLIAPDQLSILATQNQTEQICTVIGLIQNLFGLNRDDLGNYLDTITGGDYLGFTYKLLNTLSDKTTRKLVLQLMASSNSTDTSKMQSFTSQQVKYFNGLLKNTPITLEKWVWEDKAGDKHPFNIPAYNGFSLKPLAINCYDRYTIAFIGKDFPQDLIDEIWSILEMTDGSAFFPYFKQHKFETIEDLKNYILDKNYGKVSDKPTICFGVRFDKEGDKFNTSLHYFDNYIMEGIEDVPNHQLEIFEEMQVGPMMEDYMIYANDGYAPFLNILANYVLKQKMNSTDAYINFGMTAQKYDEYSYDKFADFNGLYFTFFVVLGYNCPLILYILKMVVEKESRSKESMKIMGLSDGVYFLSYFVQFFIVNIIYAFGVAIFGYLMFEVIPYFVIVLYLWLFGLNVFALVYFIQSFIDKTRLALIIGALVYCLMLFVSAAVYEGTVKKSYKMLASVLPLVNLFLGAMTMGVFKAKFYDMEAKHITYNYDNYSLKSTYIMFVIDFFIYLFLGFYFENVLPKEFGIQRPWYFLFSPKYWCKKSGGESKRKVAEGEAPPNPHQNEPNFQDEDLYKDKTEKSDYFQICDIVKTFGDGKTAVNKVSFNLFKDEIFALLGHNGAGKTTLISMLTGMIEATEGEALFEGKNILNDANMDEFRTRLGICPQHDILFPDLTMEEHLEMFCYFKGVPEDQIKAQVEQTLMDFRVYDIRNIIASNLSAGQRRKLSIAISVIGGSEVIFLDEPSSGMDITSRRNLWEILKKITEKRIIILTTHYMEEASVLGSRIGILAEGNMKCIGTPLFLIERYGKYMSINIYKETGANDKAIIDFFQNYVNDITYEKLSEEILFKIPKDAQNFQIKSFFDDLDAHVKELKIKNYSASMPTLEDVFLNVAVMKKEGEEEENAKFNQNEEKNDQIMFMQKYEADYTPSQKFNSDIGILFYKRIKLIYRDIKTFFLEIICPILLTVIGCVVVQVDIFKETEPFGQDVDFFGHQVIYYSKLGNQNISSDLLNEFLNISEFVNVTASRLKYNSNDTSNERKEIQNYIETLYDSQKSGIESFASFFFTKEDTQNAQYELYELINARGRHAPGVYTPYVLNKILKYHDIDFEYTHYPLPMTEDIKGYGKSLNNFCLVFFVSIAFGLIPANFIATIVKERINNTKHLMRIAGVSLFAYWLVNFIFEIVKYYITGGVCVLILWAFDFVPDYFYILYLLYGPSMVSFTYLFSFAFDSEAIAQNVLILFNLVLGCLASTVCIMLRSLEDTTNGAKPPTWILRIIPAFAFGFGYNLLLNGKLILFIDYGVAYATKKSSEYLKLKYAGADFLYMGLTSIIYMVIIAIIEKQSYSFSPCSSEKIGTTVEDPKVLEEIERANSKDYISKIHKEGNNKDGNYESNQNLITVQNTESDALNVKKNCYSVKLKNVKKLFNKNGCCSKDKIEAIKNLSFCIEYGECFGLLGLNGAGKTTTFKCITQEHSPTLGSIEIDGRDISTHFDEIREMFGYCPQFDAIFEFMTVYENLKFYSRIKGVDPSKTDELINAMLESMMLSNYRNKVSGRLSGGNKRKLSVAISMICNPPIILLDEPSTGLDPEARRFMWAVIHKIATKRAKSSVIMTTHAMDEAETLCRRMGIMVNGEFVCLGSSNEIKERYGYGYEIDVRIKPLPQPKLDQIYASLGVHKHFKVTKDKLPEILRKLNKLQFLSHISKDKIGSKLFHEIMYTGSTSIHTLVSWIYYVNNVIYLITSTILDAFPEIVLTEFIENNFLFKVRKERGENAKTIGFLFSSLEKSKDTCNITEYSIQQTSLEQIFNAFAENQGKSEEELQKAEKKVEILITRELAQSLLN